MYLTRGCWAEVNLDIVIENANRVKALVKKDSPQVERFMAVVKANAYGCGISYIAKAMYESDNSIYFGVACLSEALLVRVVLSNAEILVLGHIPDFQIDEAVKNNITMTISSLEQAEAIDKISYTLKKKANVHIKIDTGMNRIGFSLTKASVQEIKKIFSLKNLRVEGLFTHFATAYMSEKDFVHQQFLRYKNFKQLLDKEGLSFPIVHISNTGIVLDNPEYNQSMIRCGTLLYGVYSSPDINCDRILIEDALSVRALITFVKEVGKGEGIGYDHTYYAPKNIKIATLPIGCVDFSIQKAKNCGFVLVKGVRCPIVGSVCMDQMMIDVTEVDDVKIGDEAVLIGKSGKDSITIFEMAKWSQVETYELICSLNLRLPIIYYKSNKLYGTLDINRTLYSELSRNMK